MFGQSYGNPTAGAGDFHLAVGSAGAWGAHLRPKSPPHPINRSSFVLIKQNRACVPASDPRQIYGVILQGTGLLLVVTKPQAHRRAPSPRQLHVFGSRNLRSLCFAGSIARDTQFLRAAAPSPKEDGVPGGCPSTVGMGTCWGCQLGCEPCELPCSPHSALHERFALLFIPSSLSG